MALALFASIVAPEALCTDRRTGMLDLYLAGPLDVRRYLAAKWASVVSVMLVMTVGPQLFLLASYTIEGEGRRRRGTAAAAADPRVRARVALFYTAVAMGVSSLTTRRAVAAVATVLVLLVPRSRRASQSDSGAPDELALLAPREATEFAFRVFRDTRDLVGASRRSPTSRRGRRGRARGLDPARRAVCLSATAGRQGDDDGSGDGTPLIEVRGVSKWFGSLVAVSDVSFDIGPGVTALLGPNGAGKSTMLRMLCGLARPRRDGAVLGLDPRSDVVSPADRARAAAGERLRAAHRARFVRLSRVLYDLPDPEAAARARSRRSSSTRTTSGGCRPTRRACASASSSRRRSSTTRG